MIDDEHREADVEAAATAATAQETPGSSWLEATYREHAAMVVQTAYRVTGNAADAEDVLQTVFMRLAGRDQPLHFTTGCGAYLRRAATNAALDIVQSRYARSGTSLDAAPEAAHLDPAPEPERRHEARELHALLRRALAGLSRRSAEIFVLRYFEGLDNRTIAEHLGTSAATVAVTLHRARARLKDAMAPFVGGQP